MDPDQNPTFELPTPIAKTDTSKIHLYEKIDSMWYRAKYTFGAEPGKPRSLKLVSTWDPGHEYSVEVDSAAFTDIYGKVSAKYKQGVRIPSMDEYGTLIMTLQNMEGKNCLLQLLNESDKPVKEAYAKNNQATFHYIKPGNYYLLYKQKPAAITKQKADAQRKIKRRNAERARSLDISLPDELLNSGQ